jgi:peptide-methionine (S)-S-oxide reductase
VNFDFFMQSSFWWELYFQLDRINEDASLAGGCFWGMQDLLRRHDGVASTRVGYTGGDVPNATYRNHGTHAEAIEIVFDPERISYRQILKFFFQIHDPTTKNRQGDDIGMSYRSAIFHTDENQKRIAQETIADVDASGLRPGKVVTEVAPAGPFSEAEPEHQDYLERYPDGYTCHFVRPDWKLRARPEVHRRCRRSLHVRHAATARVSCSSPRYGIAIRRLQPLPTHGSVTTPDLYRDNIHTRPCACARSRPEDVARAGTHCNRRRHRLMRMRPDASARKGKGSRCNRLPSADPRPPRRLMPLGASCVACRARCVRPACCSARCCSRPRSRRASFRARR